MRTRQDRLKIVARLAAFEETRMAGKPVSPVKAPVNAAASVPSSGKPPAAISPPDTSRLDAALAASAGYSGGTSSGKRKDRGSDRPARLVSLDAYRGFIMMMLAASGFGIRAFANHKAGEPVWQTHNYDWWQKLAFHFDHPAWISLFDFWKVAFWDLIQPAFMLMVGVSMPFSYARREALGEMWWKRAGHAASRAVILVLIGVFLSSTDKARTHWVFPNVLCQIGLGYVFVWLCLNRSRAIQFCAVGVILVGYWGLFRLNPPPKNYDYARVNAKQDAGEILTGSWAPWSKNANIAYRFDEWFLPRLRSAPKAAVAALAGHGHWLPASLILQEPVPVESDTQTSADSAKPQTPDPVETKSSQADKAAAESPETTDPNAIAPTTSPSETPEEPSFLQKWFFSSTEPYVPNAGGYTTLNFVPSIATMLLGLICGQWLISKTLNPWQKLGLMLALAAGCFALGIGGHATICPIIKRIWTPSWVLFSAGYVIGMLALFYLVLDIAPLRVLAFPLVVVGTNSILTYMMGQTISGWVRGHFIPTHLSGFIGSVFGSRALDPNWYGPIVLPTTGFLLYWLFLLWLYRQKIFLRI